MLPSLESPTDLVPINILPSSLYIPDYASGDLEFDIMGSDSSLTPPGSVRESVQYAADYADPCLLQSFVGLQLSEQSVNPEVLVEGDQVSPHAITSSKSSAGLDEDMYTGGAHSTSIAPGLLPAEAGSLGKLERINQLLAEAARLQQEVLYQEP